MTKSIIQWAMAVQLMAPVWLCGQVVVGGTTPDPSAVLDIRSMAKGVLLPRLTTFQRDAVSSPATGLTIFNTTTNCLETNLGTPAVPDWARLKCRNGVISTLNCGGAVLTGSLNAGVSATGVSVDVAYTGGNGGVYDSWSVASSGVTGLTATLSAGSFANGSGSLSFDITGTPASVGTASFALNIGGQTCTLNVTVLSAPSVCRAKVNATDYKDFMCYNLGTANTGADPFTPSWEINGGYWQWGRSAQAAAGPTGPDVGQANNGPVSGWNSTNPADDSWTDGTKTANDPCPTGYRIPTKAEWDGVLAHNLISNVGTFNNSTTNYGAGKKFGDQLTLPAASGRDSNDGSLVSRGDAGVYWSSTEFETEFAWNLFFTSGFAITSYVGNRAYGYSVRCVEDTPGTIGTLNCSGATVTGTLSSGQAASGVSVSVPYTVGNGGTHNGQVVSSIGVTGLTATLSAGNFANGSGSLFYAIMGTPASSGTASFALSIGGQTCTLNVTVDELALNCSGATVTGTLSSGQAASGVSVSVPYTVGNGGTHNGQVVSSTGVMGLTATLDAGSFSNGSGSLSYTITGTPASTGTASFALIIGGQTCTLNVTVSSASSVCRAKVTATEYKDFMCYNLGAANTSADPFTPSWEINGGYWQWGRTAEAAAGPTGPDADQANNGPVSGWNTTNPTDGSWTDGAKTANDPCPTGYRIPTKAEWDSVLTHNVISNVGTFNNSTTNYEAGKKFGDQLTLPAASGRDSNDGSLVSRGDVGVYWSSTEFEAEFAWNLFFTSDFAITSYVGNRAYGYSVRCIAE